MKLLPKGWILRAQGIVWVSFWEAFGSAGSWARFWSLPVPQGRLGSVLGAILQAKSSQKGAKQPSKIDPKIDEIWSVFLDAFLKPFCAKWEPGLPFFVQKIDENDDIIWEWILS